MTSDRKQKSSTGRNGDLNCRKPAEGPATVCLTENERIDCSTGWKRREVPLPELERLLLTHREISAKDDCAAYVPGSIRGEQRRNVAIDTLSALVLDLDKGADIDALEDAIGVRGLFALVHSTWSHGMTKTEINVEAYTKATGCTVFEIQSVYNYLRETKRYPGRVLDSLTIGEPFERDGKVMVTAHHGPLPKYRVVFPLLKSFDLRQVNGPHIWKARSKPSPTVWDLTGIGAASSRRNRFTIPRAHPAPIG